MGFTVTGSKLHGNTPWTYHCHEKNRKKKKEKKQWVLTVTAYHHPGSLKTKTMSCPFTLLVLQYSQQTHYPHFK